MDTCQICHSAALRVVVTKKGRVYQRCITCGTVYPYTLTPLKLVA